MKESKLSSQLSKEFYYMAAIGNVYPPLHTKGWIAFSIVNHAVSYSWMISSVILTGYTTFLVMDQPSFMSQALHVCIAGVVCVVGPLSIMVNRKKAKKFEAIFCEPESFAPYAKSEYFQRLKAAGYKNKDRLFIFWFGMYGSCGMLALLQNTIDSWAGVEVDVKNVNGVWINLPFVLWFPGDLENDVTMWLIAYSYEIIFLLWCVIQVVSAIVMCFSISGKIMDQMKLNVWALENLDSRAKEKFSVRYPQRKIKDMPKEYDDCYYDCIVENVKHHYLIKREFDLLLDVASIGMAVPFYGGALFLGMTLITIVSEDDPRVAPKILAASLAIGGTINMYCMCKVGQDFHDISAGIFDTLFYTNWYKRSKRCTKALMIMRCGSCRPMKLVAGRLLTLNMGFFADVVNSAYSIFNLNAANKG